MSLVYMKEFPFYVTYAPDGVPILPVSVPEGVPILCLLVYLCFYLDSVA